MKEINLTPYILETGEASPIIKTINCRPIIANPDVKSVRDGYYFHHLYLCSSEGIKEGDWVIDKGCQLVFKYSNIKHYDYPSDLLKTIHLTTDPKLISDGVAKIDVDTKVWIDTDLTDVWHKLGVPFLSEFCKRWNESKSTKGSGFINLDDETVYLLQESRNQLEYLNNKFTPTGTTNSVISRIETKLQSISKPAMPSLSISYNTETRSLAIK